MQLFYAPVVRCQATDFSSFHNFPVGNVTWILKAIPVPALEKCHKKGNVTGRNASILLDCVVEPCQFLHLQYKKFKCHFPTFVQCSSIGNSERHQSRKNSGSQKFADAALC